MIVITGGEVLTREGWTHVDVRVEGGLITEVGRGLRAENEISAKGCLVGPGFADIHTHLREPGETWKEDIQSGSRAAAAGGFTAIVAMPNTEPVMDSVETVDFVRARGEEVGLVDVVPAGALTVARQGTRPTDLESLYEAGVRVFSDDGDGVEDPELLKEIMRRLADLPGAVLAQHAEIKDQTSGGHMHHGDVSARLGVGGLPSRAESEMVGRDLDLVAATGVTYHCQHVSAAETVELISEARDSGLNVTAEVTPHHLALSDQDVATLDPDFKMYPPLRSPADREALVDGLLRGVISVVATDHAPHSKAEKAVPFVEAPRGVIGLETSAAVTWSVLGNRDRFFEVMSVSPRLAASLDERSVTPGAVADLVVFDPEEVWKTSSFESKSSNSPFTNKEMKGRVVATIYKGEVTHG